MADYAEISKIEEAKAFIRGPGGLFSERDVYARGDRVFVPWAGGFVRVCAKLGGEWVTSKPRVAVVDFKPVPGLRLDGEPTYQQGDRPSEQVLYHR